MKTLVTFKARLIYAAVVVSVAITLSFIAMVVYVNQVDQRREKQGEETREATCDVVREMVHQYEEIGTENATKIADAWKRVGRQVKCEES